MPVPALATGNLYLATLFLERNIVFLKLLFFAERLFRGGLLLILGARWTPLCGTARLWRTILAGLVAASSLVSATATTTRRITSSAHQLEIIDDDDVLGTLAAALLVFPGIVFEPAFDQELLALLAILIDHLGAATET